SASAASPAPLAPPAPATPLGVATPFGQQGANAATGPVAADVAAATATPAATPVLTATSTATALAAATATAAAASANGSPATTALPATAIAPAPLRDAGGSPSTTAATPSTTATAATAAALAATTAPSGGGSDDGAAQGDRSSGQAPAQVALPALAPAAGAELASATTAHAPAGAAPAPPSAPSPTPSVPLGDAVETVRFALHAAARNGIAQARISLHPQELGGIEIHLRQTAAGLVARVVADSAVAAQTLQQSGAELRRDLEGQGLTLLTLDIGASGDERGGAQAQQDLGARTGRPAAGAADRSDATAVAGAPTRPRTLELANGALVDVLA
ncbi:MAG: flagellar hook-length control protein, partial [Conexibacter sp.]|nr:flagellar hook-length control protein [Conexibacter sp.]